jgi:heme/copper-type cytochrome/quinol oxidase subunit 2
MRYLRQIWRGARTASLVLAGWLAVHGAALAQGAPPAKPAAPQVGSGVYVFAYFLVILGVAFGMLAVCISSRRRDRARPEQYERGKVAVTDETK